MAKKQSTTPVIGAVVVEASEWSCYRNGPCIRVTYKGKARALVAFGGVAKHMVEPGVKGRLRVDEYGDLFRRKKDSRGYLTINRFVTSRQRARTLPGVAALVSNFWPGARISEKLSSPNAREKATFVIEEYAALYVTALSRMFDQEAGCWRIREKNEALNAAFLRAEHLWLGGAGENTGDVEDILRVAMAAGATLQTWDIVYRCQGRLDNLCEYLALDGENADLSAYQAAVTSNFYMSKEADREEKDCKEVIRLLTGRNVSTADIDAATDALITFTDERLPEALWGRTPVAVS